MKILCSKESGVAFVFTPSEYKAAISLLEAMYKLTKLSFLKEAIEEIKITFEPKPLPYINYFHLCQCCFKEIDERKDDSIHYTGKVDKWIHRQCK